MRWLWLKKTQPDRPWAKFDIQVHPNAAALFAISIVSTVGDGTRTLFWTDRWLQGESIQNLAPALVALVPRRVLHKRTVQEALDNQQWIEDIRGSLPGQAFYEYFLLWDIMQQVQLSPGVQDQHRWTPSSSGVYSSKSAYSRFFLGSTEFEPAKRIWKSWVPPRCQFFLWLASLNRCWTADRLARRGLDPPDQCLLCDQEEETMQHILVACVFSRAVWHQVLTLVGLPHCSPDPSDQIFQEWWQAAEHKVPKQQRAGHNSLVALVAWCLWKLRNNCVFEGAPPSLPLIIQDIKEDAKLWSMDGAHGLSDLWPQVDW